MAAQRLQMAAHGAPYGCSEAAFGCRGVAFAAEGLSMAPMRQICSICCIWLGWAGLQDGREHGQSVVNG